MWEAARLEEARTWGRQAADLLPGSPPWPEGICLRKPRKSPRGMEWGGGSGCGASRAESLGMTAIS